MEVDHIETWDHLRSLLDADPPALDNYLQTLSGTQVVRALLHLGDHEQRLLLLALNPATAADIIEDVPDEHAADLIEGLPAGDAATIIEEMESDRQADVLAEVEDLERSVILENLPAAIAADAIELMAYAPDSAGGLMVRKFLAYPASTHANEVLRDIMSPHLDVSRSALQYAYVVSETQMLQGSVRVRDLIGQPQGTPLAALVQPATVINVDSDLNTMRDCFEEAEVLALPVTTDDGHLAGVLLHTDVEESLVQRAEEDHLKSFGIVGGEELRTMPVGRRSRRRLSWLTVNIALNLAAASVIAAFEDTLTAVIALAVFLPIVSDMSGCSGNQAVAVSMRELTLGVIDTREALRVWWQEVQVGLINGVALGILLGMAAWAWKGNPALGVVVGTALGINTVIAVSIGGTVPLLLKRFGADPAVASGPVLTTVTDICGFFLVLGIATAALPWLT